MSSHYRNSKSVSGTAFRVRGLAACAAMLAAVSLPLPAAEPLRVCSDPNNLPFSNRGEQGFENRVAQMAAEALGRSGVEYTWWPLRLGHVGETLEAGRCDVLMGVPSQFEIAEPTVAYYRSAYSFVYRKDSGLSITSLDDPKLRDVRVGVQMAGDDYSNTPGAEYLGRRGDTDNLVGYNLNRDYSKPNPPARLIEAVAKEEVAVAIAWGPRAGYFAQRSDVPLKVVPISPPRGKTAVPFEFGISMAVREDDDELRRQLNRFIRENRGRIRAVLEGYGVPLVEGPQLAKGDSP